MNHPEWAVQLWEEWQFRLLVSGESDKGFERLFQRIKRLASNDDFLDMRPAGIHGDFKCDGWDLGSKTCYAAYAPFTRKTVSEVKSKLTSDFKGAVESWPDMQA
jgi:hypothetical protein